MPYTFWPKDTDNKIYIGMGASLIDIMRRAAEKWPNMKYSDIYIDTEYIQTNSIGYDLYDSTDFTNFIVICNTSLPQ